MCRGFLIHPKFSNFEVIPDFMKQPAKKITKTPINKDLKSYENDPFVIKKNKESKAFLEKHGFPEELLQKR